MTKKRTRCCSCQLVDVNVNGILWVVIRVEAPNFMFLG